MVGNGVVDGYIKRYWQVDGSTIGIRSYPNFEPSGIALNEWNVFVSDLDSDIVRRFNKATLGQNGASLNYGMTRPESLEIFGGKIFVANTENSLGYFVLNEADLTCSTCLGWGYGNGNPYELAVSTNPSNFYINGFIDQNNNQGWYLDTAGENYTGLELGDVDNDDDLDIIVIKDTGGEMLKIYKNDGGWSFSAGWEYSVGGDPKGLSLGDINNDGWLDIVVAMQASTPHLRYFENRADGSGDFNYGQGSNLAGAGYDNYTGSQIEVANLDGSGDLEVVASAEGTGAASEKLGIVVFGQQSAFKYTQLTIEVGTGSKKIKIIRKYRVNGDDTLGSIISTELR
ncbi:hypothetical protein BVX98_01930 [bacterium F11]|nr:hypothetical protein BVX98_01930 [bacterium F11]